MPSYKNQKCPVCNQEFKDGDDIVTCPICGTPHHRECYNKIGHCFNEDKHAQGYEFKKSNEVKSEEKASPADKSTPVGSYFSPQNSANEENGESAKSENAEHKSNTKKCVNCGEEINKNAPFCNKCGARQPMDNPSNPQSFIPNFNTGYEHSNLTIDGESAEDVAGVIKTNIPKFIDKFKSGKKFSWNWAGFIFGPYYLFFRKMYKEGSIFLALQLIVSLVAQGLYAKPYAKLMQFVSDNAAAISSGKLSSDLVSKFSTLYEKILPMMLIMTVANLVFHIIIALCSNNFYKATVIKKVKDVNQKIDEGGMLEQMMPFANSAPLSQDDLKKLYLNKVGGTTFFAPVMAFCILDIITSIISQL